MMEQPEAASDDELSPHRGAYFPRRLVTELYELMKSRSDLFEVITYGDLDWVEGDDAEAFYPGEMKAWTASLAKGRRDRDKIHVLIQYDVDSQPQRTMGLLADPAHRGVPANVMLFNRRIDRRLLSRTGELSFTDYGIDDALLRQLEGEGFVVGYHVNAHEQALFDLPRAHDIFLADLAALRTRFGIRFVSAHGGVAGPDGRNNRDLPYPPDLRRDAIWVHNGRTPRFAANFSDGGHNKSPDPSTRDLRNFVRAMQPGKRYRILLHPQYYDVMASASRRFTGTPWYDGVIAASQSPAPAYWAAVAADLPRERRPTANVLAMPIPPANAAQPTMLDRLLRMSGMRRT